MSSLCSGGGNRGYLPPKKSRIAAALWALFLGGAGGHKFYLNQPGWGILYLVFILTFIPAIIATIEVIMFLLMTDEAFDYKYNPAHVR